MEFGENLKRARERAGLTQDALADKMGVAANTVYRWEAQMNVPKKFDTILKLAEILNVSPNDLAGLPPKIYLGVNATPGAEAFFGDSNDIPTPATGKEIYPYTEMIRVPIYESAYAACAGNGNHNDGVEPAIMEYRMFDISEVGPISVDPDKHPFGIRVEGESMEDANIPDGSIAVINPGVEWNSGTPVLAKIGETCVIKWVETRGTTLVFYSASSAYPPRAFTLEEQNMIGVNVIGPVVDVRLKPKWMK